MDIIQKAIDVSEAIGLLPPKPKPCYYDDPYLGYQKDWVISMVGNENLGLFEAKHRQLTLKKLERDFQEKDWINLPMMDMDGCPFVIVSSCDDELFLLLKTPDFNLDGAYLTKCTKEYISQYSKPTMPPAGFLLRIDSFLTRVGEYANILVREVLEKRAYTKCKEQIKDYFYYFSPENTTLRQLDGLDLDNIKGFNPPIFYVGYSGDKSYMKDVIELYLN